MFDIHRSGYLCAILQKAVAKHAKSGCLIEICKGLALTGRSIITTATQIHTVNWSDVEYLILSHVCGNVGLNGSATHSLHVVDNLPR